MTEINAKIVGDSVNIQKDRLTTFLLTYPRIIHSEMMTHRCFSRNSASSRAIPFTKMIKMVRDTPFIPRAWMQDHAGMQGTKYIDEFYVPKKIKQWLNAKEYAVSCAETLNSPLLVKTDPSGIDTDTKPIEGTTVSKQICNRLLETFMWHKVLITSTDFENFFSLRAENQAENHIQELAYKMLEEYNKSTPKFLQPGEWHIPYGDEIDEKKLLQLYLPTIVRQNYKEAVEITKEEVQLARIKIAVARCARTSYTTIDTELKHDYENDIKLCDRLTGSGHFSPMEHVARTMSDREYENFTHTYLDENDELIVEKGWCGNFKGFIQYRKMIKNENKKDSRVIKK